MIRTLWAEATYLGGGLSPGWLLAAAFGCTSCVGIGTDLGDECDQPRVSKPAEWAQPALFDVVPARLAHNLALALAADRVLSVDRCANLCAESTLAGRTISATIDFVDAVEIDDLCLDDTFVMLADSSSSAPGFARSTLVIDGDVFMGRGGARVSHDSPARSPDRHVSAFVSGVANLSTFAADPGCARELLSAMPYTLYHQFALSTEGELEPKSARIVFDLGNLTCSFLVD